MISCGRQGAAVGGLVGQALDFQQQRRDFASAPSAVLITLPARWRVVDRLVDAVDLAAQRFAGDQAGGGVLAGVDLQAAAQPLQARGQVGLVLVQRCIA